MSVTKICEVGNHRFTLEEADIAAYKKFGFEPLPICFPHQHQWRLSFRNDRFLHRRKCDLTGAEIISMYPADAPYKIYEREAWFSDRWDPLTYGRPFDFNRAFFEQFEELQNEVPRMSLVNIGSINSDYCNSCVFNKNCYLIFGGDRNEDCMFGSLPMYCRNCVDCDWTTSCELCYFCVYSEKCYGCRFTFNSKNCTDCAFIEDCIGCHDCVLSFNLKNKSYYIENKPYSKEEYFKRKQDFFNGSFQAQQKFWQRFLELRQKRIVKYSHIVNGQNVSGDYIFNSKNCQNCYECIDCEDCSQCLTIFESKDCFASDYIGKKSILNFNNVSSDTAYQTWFSYWTVSSSDIEYCVLSNFSKNCFGCIGMRHQEFCVLNKKYSKDEFFKVREKIIEHMKRTGEWGKFFPKQLSTFPYNESTASYFFPLKKQEALDLKFKWHDESFTPKPQTYEIPDNINDVSDTILNETLSCEQTRKNFRLISQELTFYQNQKIAIPRLHPDTRYYLRLSLRNPQILWNRNCQKCKIPFESPYPKGSPETVYCEKCYLEAVY